MKKVLPVVLLLLSVPLLTCPAQGTARVAGDLQSWADADRNGILEPRELDSLVTGMTDLLSGPHPDGTPLDRMFDVNGDGRIGPEELERARQGYFKPKLQELAEASPEAARRVDLNADGRIDEREAQLVVEYLFIDEKARAAHRVDTPSDRMADLNNDGRTGGEEFVAYRNQVVRSVAILPALLPGEAEPGPGAQPQEGLGEVMRWADANGSGALEPGEIDRLSGALVTLLSGPHPGNTPLDALFDGNRNGRVEVDELQRARVELFRPLLVGLIPRAPDVARLVDLNGNGTIEEPEAQLVVEYLFADEKARAVHRVASAPDRRADMNGDGTTGGDEFIGYRDRIAQGAALVLWSRQEPQQKELVPDTSQVTEGTGGAAKTTTKSAAAATAPASTATPAATAAAPAATTTTTAAAPAKAETVKLGFTASVDQIFPIFLKHYDTAPIGTATLSNEGTVSLEKIKVQLIVKEYMTDKKLCASLDRLDAGEKKDVSLYALFTRAVLDISEATKSQANISVEYTAAGQAKTEEFVETVSFLNRNNMAWDDTRRIAAFVTKNDPSVMLFRSSAVTAVDEGVTAVDANLRTAIALHGTLALYGVKYWADPKSSYETKSASKTEVDYLQFPSQTLQLKTGDCDDLSILWSALLEASSVSTAFITVPGHISVALALDMTAADAKKSALAQEDLIYTKDKVWVPIEVTSIKDGFLKAWQAGAKEWRDASARATPGFTTFEEASARFAPVGFSSGTPSLSLPTGATISTAYKTELKKIVDREVASQLASIQADIAKNKDKPDPLNRLGVLYARYGLVDQAEAQFTAALKVSATYVPALVNLGNLSFLKGDAAKALQYFEQAQKKDPDKATVLLGIARANHELENYGKVKEAYEKLKKLDTTLAARFAYLDLQGSDATKAADVAGVSRTVVWDEK